MSGVFHYFSFQYAVSGTQEFLRLSKDHGIVRIKTNVSVL